MVLWLQHQNDMASFRIERNTTIANKQHDFPKTLFTFNNE